MGRSSTFSTATLRNCLRARSQYSLGSTIGNTLVNPWDRTSWSRAPNLGLVCARSFATGLPTGRQSARVVCLSKELTDYLRQEQTRLFRNSSILLMGKRGKKPPKRPSCAKPPKFAPGSRGKQRGPPCRQPYERQKPCPPPEKCIPPSPPCCRRRPLNPKCPDQPKPPCPPPCPTPCPKPPKKPPPPKICYRKCPPPPKPPRLPKCPKMPAPPPPPPPPKLPRLPKCPPPCPPPPAPPLPKCPRAPKCPECPPQKECPPPPPCEPCPCPPPCPPPCCPPPPPCPPCPPPIPCPKPLPCPPPPPPKVCPPCPPCPECPKPPPCPPPPPCCPCPCPKPPPPCPCPKPCPPCKKPPEPSCPKDVPSCPKCPGRNPKKRKMSTYAPSVFLSLRGVHFRRLHVCSTLLGKSSKPSKPPSCKSVNEICQQTKKGGPSCVRTCERKSSECDKKRPVCSDKPRKLEKRKRKKKKKKKEDCVVSCIPKGKCDLPPVAKPPKMEYGPAKCPTPKFVAPQPCPELPDQCENGPHVEIRSYIKPKKEVCVPPPLPKPPTKPVVLCPCPPPTKMHPGPCPCYDMKQDLMEHTKQITMPPCPVKDKYVCCKDPLYCPPEKLICKKEKVCDPEKWKKRRKRNKPTS